jgi:hypothetical protein
MLKFAKLDFHDLALFQCFLPIAFLRNIFSSPFQWIRNLDKIMRFMLPILVF